MNNRCWWITFVVAVAASAAQAVIVVDHSNNRAFGTLSDTLSGPPGTTQWKLVADDIAVDSTSTIQHVTWWGFYWDDVVPITETTRIRLYNARPSDSLPGSILFEESLLDPQRVATGVIVSTGWLPAAEYQFEADLLAPMSLVAHTPYWLEIAQVGDIDSKFFWMGGNIEGTGVAVLDAHPDTDWQAYNGFNMSFQLSTVPEPGTLVLLGLGAALCGRVIRKPICTAG